MRRIVHAIHRRGSSGRAALSRQIRRAGKFKPSRRHTRAALLATVPASALLGFAGVQSMTPVPAAAAVISMPIAPEAALPEPLAAHAPEAPVKAVQASYYGKEFVGKPTASGERFNPEALTAAHRTLKFGSIVKVTNAATGKSVEVRINDRGPFHGNREIDLSTAAARKIGMLPSGTAKVILEVTKRG
ncbi:MAG TPA: septal ring lytic transglycosylase RlpA family protein [Sphingomicrobium sp.]|nr:septal ring lytic transglycosylase RlpA family protein [Sphingomicrobium sp.]